MYLEQLERLTLKQSFSTMFKLYKEQELILICEQHMEKAKKLMINEINKVPQNKSST